MRILVGIMIFTAVIVVMGWSGGPVYGDSIDVINDVTAFRSFDDDYISDLDSAIVRDTFAVFTPMFVSTDTFFVVGWQLSLTPYSQSPYNSGIIECILYADADTLAIFSTGNQSYNIGSGVMHGYSTETLTFTFPDCAVYVLTDTTYLWFEIRRQYGDRDMRQSIIYRYPGYLFSGVIYGYDNLGM